MNVVAFDLSLTATGVAAAAGTEVLATKLKGCERLAWLRDQVANRVGLYGAEFPTWARADLVVVEDYAFSRANQAHAKGELGGVIRLALHDAGIPFVLVKPNLRAKYATGKGNAGKGEVLAAAIRRLGYEGYDDNEADALWLRTMALDHLGDLAGRHPVPESHRVALEKIEWPDLAMAA